jgi:hypothetical protein
MNQDRLMLSIQKNLAAIAASQKQSEARSASIDRQMKKISLAQKRIADGLSLGFAVSDNRGKGRKKH